MSSIHIPPIPSIKMVTSEGFPTPEEAMWRQQELFSRSPWTAYTPTVTHLTGLTIDCAYVQLGKATFVRIGVAGTSDGTAANITLPFKAKSQNQTFAVTDLTAGGAGEAVINGGDLITLTVAKYDGSAPVNASAHNWVVTGVYEAQ